MLKRKTPLRKGSGLKKGKSLRRQSDKHRAGKQSRIEHGEAMMELFQRHWESRVFKNCEVCGAYLGTENLTLFHDHAYEKSKYPEYALDIECLILVCGACHGLRNAGFALPRHLELIAEAKSYLDNKKRHEDGQL